MVPTLLLLYLCVLLFHAQFFQMNLDSYQLAQFEIDCKKLLLHGNNANQPACAIDRPARAKRGRRGQSSRSSSNDNKQCQIEDAIIHKTQDSNALPALNEKSQECILSTQKKTISIIFTHEYSRYSIMTLHERSNLITNVDPSTSTDKRMQSLHQKNIYKEQAKTLCLSISLISELAAIDISHPDHSNASQMNAKATIQAKLDELQKAWKLEDTALPSLIASIYRLHSNIHNLQQESTNLTSKIQCTDNELRIERAENSKLKKACRKLFHQNNKLSEKLKKKKEESCHFVTTMAEQLLRKRQEGIATEELLVACHENMMKKDSSNGNRSRISTANSSVSDIDMFSQSENLNCDIRDLNSNELLDESLPDYECNVPHSPGNFVSTVRVANLACNKPKRSVSKIQLNSLRNPFDESQKKSSALDKMRAGDNAPTSKSPTKMMPSLKATLLGKKGRISKKDKNDLEKMSKKMSSLFTVKKSKKQDTPSIIDFTRSKATIVAIPPKRKEFCNKK